MHKRINFSTLPFVVLIFDGKKCHAAHGHAEIEAGGESGARTDELYEILLAQDETGLVDCLRNWDRLEPLPQLLFEPLSVKCRHYHTVGGLPEAVSAWCEKRDLTLARERGYAPNPHARCLKTGRSGIIGLVVGGISERYSGCYAQALLNEAEKYGLRLVISTTNYGRERERNCLQDLLHFHVDGVIYPLYFDPTTPLYQELKAMI